MRTFLRLLRACFGCAHRDTYREYRGGVLHLVCLECDRTVPAIQRSKKELKVMRAKFTKRSKRTAEIVRMPARRQAR